MDLKQENWYGLSGAQTGYEQVRARIAFLEREYLSLSQEERDYEIRIVKRLIESIPNEASRLIWQVQVNEKLEAILEIGK